jgi:hypothetical protein
MKIRSAVLEKFQMDRQTRRRLTFVFNGKFHYEHTENVEAEKIKYLRKISGISLRF